MPKEVVKEQKLAQINHVYFVDILQLSHAGAPEISPSAPKVKSHLNLKERVQFPTIHLVPKPFISYYCPCLHRFYSTNTDKIGTRQAHYCSCTEANSAHL